MMQGVIVVATGFTLKERLEELSKLSDFNQKMLEVACILCYIAVFLGPLHCLPETGKKARFLMDWENLQVSSCHLFIFYQF